MVDKKTNEPMLYVSYIDLTPDLENLFKDFTHKPLIESLRNHFLDWKGFFVRKENYSLGFFIVTNREVKELEVKGPEISRRLKAIDYSIFLPEIIENLSPEKFDDVFKYLDWVFSGISLALSNYKVSKSEIDVIKAECKQQLENEKMCKAESLKNPKLKI